MHDKTKYDPFRDQEPWYKVFWRRFDRGIDSLIWLKNACCFYISVFWLMPMILVIFADYFFGIRQIVGPFVKKYFVMSLAGIPLWLVVSAYSRISVSSLAKKIVWFEEKSMVAMGCILLIGGGLLWLMGAI